MDIRTFLKIENKYALYDKNIKGINYWNYSRVQIWNYEICVNRLKLGDQNRNKKSSLKEQIKIILHLMKRAIWRGKKASDVDILFVAHERRTKIDGYYQCIYTECLAQSFPDSLVLDRPYQFRHLQPETELKRYYGDYITLISNLYYHMHKLLKTIHYKNTLKSVKNQMNQPLSDMIKSYHLSESVIEKLYGILHKNLLLAECDLKLYDKLLKRVKPKIIVEVVYYSMHNMILNELAKKHNICTIELQHGTMHKDHAAYQINWDHTISQLPDEIFLFSNFWKKMIHMPIADNNLVVTGYPYFEKNVNKYLDRRATKLGNTILFISQATIGDMLSELAVEVARKLLPQGYRIIYKLHPDEVSNWKNQYICLRDSGIEVEECKEIYECFLVSDIQVGVYSTAIYEGLGFGLKTMIYNVGHADTMYELANEGYVRIINNSQELIEAVFCEDSVLQKGDLFWEKNALNNMSIELKRLLKVHNKFYE